MSHLVDGLLQACLFVWQLEVLVDERGPNDDGPVRELGDPEGAAFVLERIRCQLDMHKKERVRRTMSHPRLMIPGESKRNLTAPT